MRRNDQFVDESFDAEANYAPGGQFGQPDPYYEGSQVDGDHHTAFSGDYSSIPDIFQLNHVCANAISPSDNSHEAQLEAEESWEPVREWLRNHSADQVRQAAEQRGDSSMTALHFACRNQPPIDVVNVFLSIALETVQWPDTFGWLPIHYACASGAHQDVIKALAEAFPESKTTVDRRGRTPLHFALGNGNQNPGRLASPAVVAILSSSGAAAYADDNGMLVSISLT
jgi:ankyrin repeat protein